MRKEGYTTAIVEKWNHHVKIRQDLYGFIDVLGVGEEGTLAVQTTTANNMKARINKIEDEKLANNLAAVRKAGWKIEVHGWHKVKNRWQVKVVDIS